MTVGELKAKLEDFPDDRDIRFEEWMPLEDVFSDYDAGDDERNYYVRLEGSYRIGDPDKRYASLVE